jgi:hypothetical protein
MALNRPFVDALVTGDINLIPMRYIARETGLMQLLLEIHHSPDLGISEENCQRLGMALDLLGATDREVQK